MHRALMFVHDAFDQLQLMVPTSTLQTASAGTRAAAYPEAGCFHPASLEKFGALRIRTNLQFLPCVNFTADEVIPCALAVTLPLPPFMKYAPDAVSGQLR